ncbi:Two-component sensor histidine kinase [Planktothrix serta PCC 8927]|uniref:histidine kinase n=1 Tax=Planktothrix serta PCC 8927 TaxID=671068 RepID=A0A7Z9BX33_9CYAN|nr:PAS domain S-box protein [Planktothrix serta]VXD24342.1 Two-component sensor histidine kinase [Planktothrix serta PCC 8927]
MKMINQNSQTETQFIASLQAVNQRLIQEIQERQRVEEALRESSERLKTLINAMPDLVCFKDGSGRWLEANQAILELFQLNTLDYQGKSDTELAELVEQVHGTTLYRNALIACQQSDEQAWKTKQLSQQEEIIPTSDGTLKVFDVIKVPLFNPNGERKGLVILGRDITERQKTEDAYKRLAAIVESSEDGIMGKTIEGKIMSWNQGAEQIYGYSEAEVKGRLFSFLTLPERFKEMPQILASIQSGGSIDHYETVHIRKDGQHIDVSLTISPIKDAQGNITGLSTISRDISYRKRIEKTLEQLRHQNELILDSAGEGICGLNREGKITFANPAATRMTGYTVRELLMSDWHKITEKGINVSPIPSQTWQQKPISVPHKNPDHQQDSQIFATLKDGQVRHVTDEVFWRQDGTFFPIEYVSTPIENQGEIIGAVVTFKDITERQAMEKMKDEFISVVSHELRTPLTSIHGALGLLASGLLDTQPERAKRMLEIAVTNTTRLVRLINDILDLERMQAGQITLDKKACNLADLMLQATNEMMGIAEKTGVKILMKPLDVRVWAAPDRIIQMLTNLLSNAIRFSSVESCVWFNATRSPSSLEVLITVQDQGRGIPADKLETIFGRFQQVDASDSRQKGGTGLGLAICRTIVQQHSGHIWAESTLGEGSTFFVRLPVLAEAGEDPHPSVIEINSI